MTIELPPWQRWVWGFIGGVIFALMCAGMDYLWGNGLHVDYFDVVCAFACGYVVTRV